MTAVRDSGLPVERHDVFDVLQVTRGTALQSLVAADLVEVEPHQRSSIHRHNHSETVIFITAGRAEVVVGDDVVEVAKGDRIHVGKAVYHGFRTGDDPVSFLSVQSPPILDESTGTLDLEPLADA
ncbi:MAG: cupin domain-containing protein [Actinomycetota bacterium]|nr:cupin domain-containing protein [Actinomycetota bacterium]